MKDDKLNEIEEIDQDYFDQSYEESDSESEML
jgi:hypothetical protein